MNRLTKTAALALIFLIAMPSLTLITSKLVKAQASVTPSVPEFSLKVIDHSYDVPPTTIDPGYHFSNKTIEITIKNQQFTPYSSNGKTNNLYYNISTKAHNGNEWNYYTVYGSDLADEIEPQFYIQSTSDYTVIEITPSNAGEIDVRVQAQIGNYFGYFENTLAQIFREISFSFEGKESGWSSPQTIKMPFKPTSDYTPTPTPTITSPASPSATDATIIPTETTQISGIESDNSATTTALLAAIAVLLAVIAVLLILILTGWRLRH